MKRFSSICIRTIFFAAIVAGGCSLASEGTGADDPGGEGGQSGGEGAGGEGMMGESGSGPAGEAGNSQSGLGGAGGGGAGGEAGTQGRGGAAGAGGKLVCQSPSDTSMPVNCQGDDACKGEQVDCPADGFACDVHCVGQDSCRDATITCPSDTDCLVICDGDHACENARVNCRDGACEVRCRGAKDACKDLSLTCTNQGKRCAVTCEQDDLDGPINVSSCDDWQCTCGLSANCP